MKRRTIYILNWDKYQARSDKELPWLKLWGRLFRAPWFQLLQDDEKFVTIALLDLARQFNNKIPDNVVFKGYLKGNYGVFMSDLRIFKLCKSLVLNDFLSDNCPTFVEVEGDKIREDKIREESVRPTLDDLTSFFKNQEDIATEFFDYYQANGWKVGRNQMKDWKAAARNWERRQAEFSNKKNGSILTKGQQRTEASFGEFRKAREYEKATGRSSIFIGHENTTIDLPKPVV